MEAGQRGPIREHGRAETGHSLTSEWSDRSMVKWTARITKNRVASLTICLMFAVGGLALLPAVPANASSSVVAWWNVPGGGAEELSFLCSQTGVFTIGGNALEVYNPCGTRVWMHYYDLSNDQIYAYCVNPGGGFSYDFSYAYSDLQVSSNPEACDYGHTFKATWDNEIQIVSDTYGCEVGVVTTLPSFSVISANSGCDFRIWLHENANGTGNGYCINPGGYGSYNYGAYSQIQETYNQTSCSAGGAPYPY
jgi:hypothetical protein